MAPTVEEEKRNFSRNHGKITLRASLEPSKGIWMDFMAKRGNLACIASVPVWARD